jgi:hypothetical protein
MNLEQVLQQEIEESKKWLDSEMMTPYSEEILRRELN